MAFQSRPARSRENRCEILGVAPSLLESHIAGDNSGLPFSVACPTLDGDFDLSAEDYATVNHSSRLIPASSKTVSSRVGSISSP